QINAKTNRAIVPKRILMISFNFQTISFRRGRLSHDVNLAAEIPVIGAFTAEQLWHKTAAGFYLTMKVASPVKAMEVRSEFIQVQNGGFCRRRPKCFTIDSNP